MQKPARSKGAFTFKISVVIYFEILRESIAPLLRAGFCIDLSTQTFRKPAIRAPQSN